MSFNNTTSLPLPLAQSLEATSILERRIIRDKAASKAIDVQNHTSWSVQ